MRRWNLLDDQASTAIVSFAVVIAIYALAFASLMTVLHQPAQEQQDMPVLDARAESGILDLVNTGGYFVNATSGQKSQSWLSDPDKITRFGLAKEGDPGVLDLDKLRNLTKGSFEASANGLLDYEEARAALSLGDFDFHLRTYPLFDALAEVEGKPVRSLNVSYIGDFDDGGSGGGPYNSPVQNVSAVEVSATWVNVSVTITNNGTTATVFQVEFTVHLAEGNLIDIVNTPLVLPGGSSTAHTRIYKTSSWEWDGSDHSVTVKISDPKKNVGEFKLALPDNMRTTSYGAEAAVTASPGDLSYTTSKKPRIHHEVWDGEGDDVNGQSVNISVYNGASGALVRGWQGNAGSHTDFEQLPAGWYNLTVRKVGDAAFNNTNSFQVTDADTGEFVSSGGSTVRTELASSKYERSLLVRLVDGFVNRTFDDASGDVYPDLKKVMNEDLANNLTADAIDVLVVGSNVDHNAMTSNAAKEAVKEWVLRGGLLIVLGSQDQNVNWLQPIFKAKLATSGNGLGVPDEHHPILHAPEELDYTNFKDNGRAWEFNGDDDAASFTHVILREGANKPQDVLSVSKPGHFGNGSVVLTTWTLFDLTEQGQDDQAASALYNFLLQAWGSLYVDLGPRIPDHVEVASSSRMATAPSPVFPDEKVLVRLLFYVFR